MSTRRKMQLQVATLLALGLFLLNAACALQFDESTTEPDPEATGGNANVSIDTDMDGNPEASDTGTILPGPPGGPVAQATDAATGTRATLESSGDEDGVQLDCGFDLAGAAADADCDASVDYEWDLADVKGDAEFTAVAGQVGAAPGVALTAQSQVTLACGATVDSATLDALNPQAILSVLVDPAATTCTATIATNAAASAGAGAVGSVSWAVSLASRHTAPTECLTNTDCDDAIKNKCDPYAQVCDDGGNTDGCVVQSVSCGAQSLACVATAGFAPALTACSDGRFTPCSHDGQCAAGYQCGFGVCEPTPGGGEECNVDADCDATERCASGGGCVSENGFGHGEECYMGEACPAAGNGLDFGLCVANVCNQNGGLGDDCTDTWVNCDSGQSLYCAQGTGTCESQLPIGSPCGLQNQACLGFPFFNSCINGFCALRSIANGPCEEDVDCQNFLVCSAGKCG